MTTSVAKLLLDLSSMQPLLSTVRSLAEHLCLNAVLTSLEAVFTHRMRIPTQAPDYKGHTSLQVVKEQQQLSNHGKELSTRTGDLNKAMLVI